MSDRRPPATVPGTAGTDPRSRIVAAGVRLVAEQGVAAATTRAIASAAAVQAPTIFRIFGDKDGLLDAIAEQTMADFLASRPKAIITDDPLHDLRRGMEAFMAFGIQNPDIFMHVYAKAGNRSGPAEAGYAALRERVHRVALAGRLVVTEARACDIFHALARGMVLEMLDRPEPDRNAMLHTASSVAIRAVSAENAPGARLGIAGSITLLRAHLAELKSVSPGERVLLGELLDRLASGT